MVVYATKTKISDAKVNQGKCPQIIYRMMDRIQKLLDFLRDTPEDPFLKHALALEYIKIGADPAARILFEQVLSKDPGYVGSYYHLGKLLERIGENNAAAATYEKGMEAAKQAGDNHAFGELRGAFEELTY
jgi:tetratricopeptide (TPR) repeat protein